MKSTYLLAVLALSSFAFVSCLTDELSENARETIYTRNNGADIPAHIYGNTASKTFLVIVHGGPAGSGIEYRGYYSQQLEKDYAVVYTDQRGQGMSHGKYDVENVTINQLAEDLYALSLGLKQRYGQDISLFMMGHSWGGTLGTAYMLIDSFRTEYNGWLECDGAHDIPLLNRSAIAMYKQIGG
ncbi:MAG: alpha/beta fold hydrolase, partial [Bacteroidetes bacterium]|nr:alpha/beta fold hydrolase [Bacteroidota bacterium]